MTGYRRKLMMMCPYVPQPETTVNNYTKVSDLANSLEIGLFIKVLDNTPTVFYDIERAGIYLTWDYLYKNIIQRYIWITIENNTVVTHYSNNDTTVPIYAKDSYVTLGTLRTLFPQGLKLTTVDNNLTLEYDSTLIKEENLDTHITLHNLYDYIPIGFKLLIVESNPNTVTIRKTNATKVTATNPAIDSSLAPSLPDAYVYKVLDDTTTDWVLTKDILYQIVSPGVYMAASGELVYDPTNSKFGNDTTSYDKKEPVTKDLFNFIFNGCRIIINESNLNVSITR